MKRKNTGRDPRDSIHVPDFKEKEPDIENLYKSKRYELDSIWDGETISDDK